MKNTARRSSPASSERTGTENPTLSPACTTSTCEVPGTAWPTSKIGRVRSGSTYSGGAATTQLDASNMLSPLSSDRRAKPKTAAASRISRARRDSGVAGATRVPRACPSVTAEPLEPGVPEFGAKLPACLGVFRAEREREQAAQRWRSAAQLGERVRRAQLFARHAVICGGFVQRDAEIP